MKKTAWILILVLLAVIPVHADRLFTSGIEENNLLETMWVESVGGVTIETTPVHSGTYVLKLDASGNQTRLGRILHSFFTSGTFYIRFYARFPSFPSTGHPIFLGAASGDQGAGFRIDINTDGTLDLVNVADSSTISTAALNTNQWYRIEIRALISETVGELELRLDGTSEGTLTGKDTVNTNFGKLWFGSRFSSWTGEVFIDDIALNDTNGSFQNSFPNAGKIFLVKPSGDDTVTWDPTPSSPATNFDKIDDVPGAPDDITTYTSTSTADEVDKLTLENLGAEVPSDADLILADVYARQGSDGTSGQRQIKYRIWDEADSSTDGPNCSVDLNGWRIADTDEHLVFDLGTRSKTDFDSFKAGYLEASNNTRLKRVTALWVNVEWIEAAAENPIMVIQ